MKKALALLLVLFAFGAQAVTLKGVRSCGNWLQSTKDRTTMEFLATEAWIVGYLSAVAVTTRKDVLRGIDTASIDAWMDAYCQANPLDDLSVAMDVLYRELVRKQTR